MFGRFKSEAMIHIKQNFVLYIIVFFAFITGISCGAFTVGSMSEVNKEDLGGYLQQFFNVVSDRPIDRGLIFRDSIWQHVKISFLIWLCGLFIIGIPFVLVLIGIRGFFVGFTVGFLAGNYGAGGILFFLICLFPQALIYIPCFIYMGVMSIKFAIEGYKEKKFFYSKDGKFKRVIFYSGRFLFLLALLFISALLEAFVSPLFFKLFTWIFV